MTWGELRPGDAIVSNGKLCVVLAATKMYEGSLRLEWFLSDGRVSTTFPEASDALPPFYGLVRREG